MNFIGEIGYHGCINKSSIAKFIASNNLDIKDKNHEWLVYSSQSVSNGVSNEYSFRIDLMYNQVREFFGKIPEDMDNFILASQISQAEALKFFIEFTRQKNEKVGYYLVESN